jgi:hypothetical protein
VNTLDVRVKCCGECLYVRKPSIKRMEEVTFDVMRFIIHYHILYMVSQQHELKTRWQGFILPSLMNTVPVCTVLNMQNV